MVKKIRKKGSSPAKRDMVHGTRITGSLGSGVDPDGQDIYVRVTIPEGGPVNLIMSHQVLNGVIYDLRNAATEAYLIRKKINPNEGEKGEIATILKTPIKGHELLHEVDGPGTVLRFIYEDETSVDLHMSAEAIQMLAHDILEAAQKKSPPA